MSNTMSNTLSNTMTNNNTLLMFKKLLGNNVSQFISKIPYNGFMGSGVHYCVL